MKLKPEQSKALSSAHTQKFLRQPHRKLLTRSQKAQPHDIFESTVGQGINDTIKKALWRAGFFFGVLLPTALTFIYCALFVTPSYVSEARFVVRAISATPLERGQGERTSSIMNLPSSLDQDAYVIASYLNSDAFFADLGLALDLEAIYGRPDINFFNRMPSDASADEKKRYLKKHMTTFVDGPSGIITVQVRAYNPGHAQRVAEIALERADVIVDEISERAKTQLKRRANDEVISSLERYSASLQDIRDFQNETGILDPIGDAKLIIGLIGTLTEKKLELQVEIEGLQQSGVGQNTQTKLNQRVLAAIEKQISQLRDSLTKVGEPSGQISKSLAKFAELQTEKLLSEALYEASRRALDTANSAALRRSAFLASFSPPNLPTQAKYPQILRSTLLIFLATLVIWSSLVLIVAAIEDHME